MPNISHQAGLKALKEALEKRVTKKIPRETLVKIAEFVLNNNTFEFNSKVYQQKSGKAIGAKFVYFTQTLHINRPCSLEKDFNYHKLNMKEWFIKRGYPESVIDKEMNKICFSEKGQKSQKKLKREYHLL